MLVSSIGYLESPKGVSSSTKVSKSNNQAGFGQVDNYVESKNVSVFKVIADTCKSFFSDKNTKDNNSSISFIG